MKSFLVKGIVFLLVLVTACKDSDEDNLSKGGSVVGKDFAIKSPNGLLEVNVSTGKKLTFDLNYGGTPMLAKSTIALQLGHGIIWGGGRELKGAKEETINESFSTSFYLKKTVTDKYNRLYLDFGDDFDVEFRVYDEGMAYRFISKRTDNYKIYGEQADFTFAENNQIYVAYAPQSSFSSNDKFNSSFEEMYTLTTVNGVIKDKLIMTPMLAVCGNGKKLCIAESDAVNYPGLFLSRNSNSDDVLNATFAAYPTSMEPSANYGSHYQIGGYAEYIADCNGARTFPWRVLCVAERDMDLLSNDMVYRLAAPSKITNTSWIKPGLATWDYWSWWDGRGEGAKTYDTYKHFIDFAASKGLPYYIIDSGWALNGSSLAEARPEIRLEELIEYGKQKGVGLILWGGAANFSDGDMEAICQQYSRMGIKGFKIDFWEYDNQRIMERFYKAAEVSAKYNLLMIYHGCPKPTGVERTYPNIVSYEAVKGMEFASTGFVGLRDMVDYVVTFPFIRQLAGPSDYTPGAMKNIPIGSQWSRRSCEGTRCQQLALFISIFSPLGTLCDGPTNYNNNQESIDFISKIPTVWEESVPLDAKIGQYIIIARKGHNGEWFVGGVNNKDARTVTVPLSFLTAGEYTMELMRDADDAALNAKHYVKEVKNVSNATSLTIKMAPGGGFAARIY